MTTRRSDLLRLGSEIARVRNEAGLSQRAFAEALGVHRVTVANWERGGYPVDGATLAKIEELFGVRLVFKPAGEEST